MVIIYYIIKLLSFPATLFKAFLEHLTCRMLEVPIEYAKYIQRNELCGHIEHMLAPKKGSFIMCFLPHIIMLVFGISFLIPSTMNLIYLGKIDIYSMLFIYLGVACLVNCFPLLEDAINMWDNLYGKEAESKMAAKIFLAIPAAIMYEGAYLEKYSVSLLTSIGFAYALPYIFAGILSI